MSNFFKRLSLELWKLKKWKQFPVIRMESDFKLKALEVSHELFNQYGVRSVTMDDIARELGVSKKTLYIHVEDKDALVYSLMDNFLAKKRIIYDQINAQATSPVDELRLVSQQLREDFKNVNPSLMYDLEKYHKKTWELWLDFKNNFLKGRIKENLLAGVKQGLFRQEIDCDILATFRVQQIQMAFDPNLYPREKYEFKAVQIAIYDHYVHGILTPKGKEFYQ